MPGPDAETPPSRPESRLVLVCPQIIPYNHGVPKTTVNGTGCSLADILYTGIDFTGENFTRFCSREPGDGGLVPGKLVFAEEIERFAGAGIHEILATITGGASPASRNLGGPAIVALINASQLLFDQSDIAISFMGAAGDDETAEFILRTIGETRLDTTGYKVVSGDSPVTYVLSDPRFHGGHGERTFINNIAAAWELGPDDLGPAFFEGDILLFGATGLVPRLHDGLTGLVRRGKERGRITVVTTVYDFRSEKRNPRERWPLGTSDESYRFIDLLITDREEALRLSGAERVDDAIDFFARRGVGAAVVTSGPEPVHYLSRGGLFAPGGGLLPVCAEVGRRLQSFTGPGDTTGCGDNFAGGVIASLALQLRSGATSNLDLPSACALGMSCGGLACFYLGGTYHEAGPGEKRLAVGPLYEGYRSQLGGEVELIPFERLL